VLPELGAQHPLLLLELANDLDQDVLGNEIGVAEAVHPITNLLADLGDPVRQLAHDQVILEGKDLVKPKQKVRTVPAAGS